MRKMMTELKPCRVCGLSGTFHEFDGEQITGKVWVCSNSAIFGGACNSNAYFTEEGWNERPVPEVGSEGLKIADWLRNACPWHGVDPHTATCLSHMIERGEHLK